MKRLIPYVFVAALGSIFGAMWTFGTALAHTGSPALPSFSTGDILTASTLNNALAHLHNTLNGGIVNANLSSLAAISHSKLANPELISKAWAKMASCDGAVHATCTIDGSGGVTAIWGDGSAAGLYRVNLSYSPSAADFLVMITPETTGLHCIVTALVAGSGDPAKDNANFIVECKTGAGVATNTALDFIVMDG